VNDSESIDERDMDETAATWAARLDGAELTARDRHVLAGWLAENPVHRTRLSEYCGISADLKQSLPELAAAGGLDFAGEVPPIRRRARHRRAAWAGAGMALAAAAVALGLWVSRPAPHELNVATSVAQRQSLTLDDGTYVELDARTSLRVENGPSERHVRLADGEAYFVVSKDKSRPFFVDTPTGSVRVTGTIFDVRTVPGAELDVTVVEGSVRVRPGEIGGQPAQSVSLVAGDRLSARSSGVSVKLLSQAAVQDELAWRQGYIVATGAPLSEVLARFAYYHGRAIRAAPDAANLHVGGRFGLDDLDSFFIGLEETQPVRVSRDLNGAFLVKLREERPLDAGR
jgi:transmembrane sensor